MASTITSFDYALKAYYGEQRVENLVEADRPELAMVKKDEDFMGDLQKIALIDQRPQGTGGSFAQAQGNRTNVNGAAWSVTVGDYFGFVEIGDKVLKASRGNPGAFLENKTTEIDGLYGQMSDELSRAFWVGNGGISMGQYSSVSTLTITLVNSEDIVNFEIGQVLVASSASGSTSTDSLRAGTMTVQSVNRVAGTFTVDALIAGLTANDYIFKQGNFAGNTSSLVMYGVGEFIYSTDTSVPTLYGLTRTTDTQRRAGCRIAAADYGGLGIEERIQLLMTRMISRYKGPGADKVWLNPEDWNSLQISLQNRGLQRMEEKDATFGFTKLRVVGGGKEAEVFASRWIPQGTAFALKWDTWTLASMGKLLSPQNGDGLTMLRRYDANSYEYRLISYPALYCRAPGHNGRIPV